MPTPLNALILRCEQACNDMLDLYCKEGSAEKTTLDAEDIKKMSFPDTAYPMTSARVLTAAKSAANAPAPLAFLLYQIGNQNKNAVPEA